MVRISLMITEIRSVKIDKVSRRRLQWDVLRDNVQGGWRTR